MFTLNIEKKPAQFHYAPQQFVMFIFASQMNPIEIKESSKTILITFFLEKSPTRICQTCKQFGKISKTYKPMTVQEIESDNHCKNRNHRYFHHCLSNNRIAQETCGNVKLVLTDLSTFFGIFVFAIPNLISSSNYFASHLLLTGIKIDYFFGVLFTALMRMYNVV